MKSREINLTQYTEDTDGKLRGCTKISKHNYPKRRGRMTRKAVPSWREEFRKSIKEEKEPLEYHREVIIFRI